MEDSVEYQILVGCGDRQAGRELVDVAKLEETVSSFFERNQTDFTMMRAKGGYFYESGWFAGENALIINLIGACDHDIFRLAKSLSMFMNQEHVMVIKNRLEMELR